MTGVDQPQSVVSQPVIKDVETLKANLKEEKRARAVEAEAEPKSKEFENGKTSEPSTEAVPEGKDDEDRRKRRRISEAADGQATKPESTDPAESAAEEILDGPILPSKTAASETKAETAVKTGEALGGKPIDAPPEQAVAPARAFPETADLEAKEAERNALKDNENSENAPLADKTEPKASADSAEKTDKLEKVEKPSTTEPEQPLAVA